MPTVVRFLITLAVLAALVGAGMFYLANFVTPSPREMSVRIPSSQLKPTPLAPMPAPSTPPASSAEAEGGGESVAQ